MRAPRLDGTRAVSIGLVLLFVTIVAVKLRVVTDFHAPAGDGIGYHQLAHELRSAGRYAFGPGLPPTYARMPGWPVVVAAVDTGRGNDIETTLARGTYLNVLFDVLTALFALLIAREAGLGRATQLLAFFLVLASPLLLLDSCYLLRETFSTTIATAVFWLIARGHFRREPRWLIAAAGLIGPEAGCRFGDVDIGGAERRGVPGEVRACPFFWAVGGAAREAEHRVVQVRVAAGVRQSDPRIEIGDSAERPGRS